MDIISCWGLKSPSLQIVSPAEKVDEIKNELNDSWHCKCCTYKNLGSWIDDAFDVCEMCDQRSQHRTHQRDRAHRISSSSLNEKESKLVDESMTSELIEDLEDISDDEIFLSCSLSSVFVKKEILYYKSTPVDGSTIDKCLPREMIVNIFAYIDDWKEIVRIGFVNKLFFDASSEDVLWLPLLFPIFGRKSPADIPTFPTQAETSTTTRNFACPACQNSSSRLLSRICSACQEANEEHSVQDATVAGGEIGHAHIVIESKEQLAVLWAAGGKRSREMDRHRQYASETNAVSHIMPISSENPSSMSSRSSTQLMVLNSCSEDKLGAESVGVVDGTINTSSSRVANNHLETDSTEWTWCIGLPGPQIDADIIDASIIAMNTASASKPSTVGSASLTNMHKQAKKTTTSSSLGTSGNWMMRFRLHHEKIADLKQWESLYCGWEWVQRYMRKRLRSVWKQTFLLENDKCKGDDYKDSTGKCCTSMSSAASIERLLCSKQPTTQSAWRQEIDTMRSPPSKRSRVEERCSTMHSGHHNMSKSPSLIVSSSTSSSSSSSTSLGDFAVDVAQEAMEVQASAQQALTFQRALRKLVMRDWVACYESVRREIGLQAQALCLDLNGLWKEISSGTSRSFAQSNVRSNAFVDTSANIPVPVRRSAIFCIAITAACSAFLDWTDELEEICWSLNDKIGAHSGLVQGDQQKNGSRSSRRSKGIRKGAFNEVGGDDEAPSWTERHLAPQIPSLSELGAHALRYHTLMSPTLAAIIDESIGIVGAAVEEFQLAPMEFAASCSDSDTQTSLVATMMCLLDLFERLDLADNIVASPRRQQQDSFRKRFLSPLLSLSNLAPHIRLRAELNASQHLQEVKESGFDM